MFLFLIKNLEEKEIKFILENNYIGYLSYIYKRKPYVVPVTYYFDQVNLARILGNGSKMPSHVAIVLLNNAAAIGADLSATAADHYARHRLVTWA